MTTINDLIDAIPDNNNNDNSINIQVTKIILDLTTLEIGKDKGKKLTAIVVPVNAANQSVTWTSSDTDIATVDRSVVAGAFGPSALSLLRHLPGLSPCGIDAPDLRSANALTGSRAASGVPQTAE